VRVELRFQMNHAAVNGIDAFVRSIGFLIHSSDGRLFRHVRTSW
jgi:hypothetical protein